MDMQVRHCSRCKQMKAITDFDKRSGARSHNYKAWCKTCTGAYRNWFMTSAYHRDPETWMEKQRARHAADPSNWLFQAAKKRARNNGLEFLIVRGDISVPKTCPLLGIEIKVGRGKPCDGSPTLDRIDNSKGYIPGNVWVISYKANTIKSNANIEELETLVRALRKQIDQTIEN